MNILATPLHLNNYPLHIKQRGAALIVALILLIALSLLAVSSMNTASLDLIMTGNEQYRVRALAAAEAGIAQALKNGSFDASQTTNSVTTSSGTGNDTTTYKIEPLKNGTPLQAGEIATVECNPTGGSAGEFGAVHFRVTSTGASERSASAQVIQEMYQVVRTGTEGCNSILPGLGTALN